MMQNMLPSIDTELDMCTGVETRELNDTERFTSDVLYYQ